MVKFTFTAGTWNVHEGHETFGPGIRPAISLEEKIKKYAEIGMDVVLFHDDDAIPDMNNMNENAIIDYSKVYLFFSEYLLHILPCKQCITF